MDLECGDTVDVEVTVPRKIELRTVFKNESGVSSLTLLEARALADMLVDAAAYADSVNVWPCLRCNKRPAQNPVIYLCSPCEHSEQAAAALRDFGVTIPLPDCNDPTDVKRFIGAINALSPMRRSDERDEDEWGDDSATHALEYGPY